MSANTSVHANSAVYQLETRELEAVSGGLNADIKPLTGSIPFDKVITINSSWASFLIARLIY